MTKAQAQPNPRPAPKRFNRFLFIALFGLGFASLSLAAWPFLSSAFNQYLAQEQTFLFPLSADNFLAKVSTQPQILGDFNNLTTPTTTQILDQSALLDYTNLQNWFSDPTIQAQEQSSETYLIDIPKLEISNALVKIGGVDIENNLVQFNPEVTIGDYGTPVIFGHSTLRSLYNPKESNKNRYQSIFSTIMTLEKDDLIKVKQGSLVYTYRVTDIREVPTDDPQILAQNPNAREIRLVTCTPEGTFLRRGLITAQLVI